MGIVGSKTESSPLVGLCRDRKELIRAAAYCRYDLAAVHIMYLQSLGDVSNALNRFVREGLVILSDSSCERSEQDSYLKFSSVDSESECSSTGVLNHDSEVSEGSRYSKPSSHCHGKTDVNCMRKSSSENCSKIFMQPGVVMPTSTQGQDLSNYFPWHHQNDFGFPQNGNRMMDGATRDVPQNNRNPGFHQFSSRMQLNDSDYYRTERVLDNPPTTPKVSDWEYLNIFNMIDDTDYSYYSQDSCLIGSNNINQDIREVREREGIPDLEGETDCEKDSAGSVRKSSGFDTSEAAPPRPGKGVPLSKEKKKKSHPNAIEEDINDSLDTLATEEEEHNTKDGVSAQGHTSIQDAESLGSISSDTLDSCGPMNLQEIVKEIRYSFETACKYGKEVSVLLELGRLPHQPLGAKFKAFASRIIDLIPMVTSPRQPAHIKTNRLSPRTLIEAKAINRIFEDRSRKFGDLSSTLEQLCAWENKLYDEVMGEEKLRLSYDKECKRLKILDEKAAEASEIDNTQASIRSLLSKINVAVAAVDFISRRIQKLRDEELPLQLNELIEGLIRMWDAMVKCHQKQFRAIVGTEASIHIIDPNSRMNKSRKVTRKLEKEILNWGTRFSDFVRTLKAFVQYMNEWLLRYIFQGPEATPDGIPPFSPSSMGAPPIFIVCNDWFHAVDKISETEVCKAINDFASSLHWLWEKQDEECRERYKCRNLSKEFEKLLRTLHEEGGTYLPLASDEFPAESDSTLPGRLNTELIYLKKRFDEQKARHEEVVKQVNDAASSCLQKGLVPIFEALESFCLENSKAYKQIRFLNREALHLKV